MSMIENRRRAMANKRKKELDELRKKSGKVKVVKLVYKKGTK